MSTIVRWVLNWIATNAKVSLYTSHVPVGHHIGGHDIPQVADCYIIFSVLFNNNTLWTGYFQAT
jgi:hypothetical protein